MIKIKANKTADEVMVVNWQLSRYCELSCHYCTSYEFTLTTKKNKHTVLYSDEELRVHDRIADILPKIVNRGNLMFYGGEPTLHPKGIEYFNKFCQETVDNHNVTIFLVTHGDISLEKISMLDPGQKKEHVISISYHHYQVKFEEWFEKVKLINQKTNAFVSAIIPRQPKVWDQFEKNMRIIFESGINMELKSELDPKTNEPDMAGLARFKELFEDCIKHRNDVTNLYYVPKLYLDDGKQTATIGNMKMMSVVPIIPNKTICKTRNFNITEGMNLRRACELGEKFQFTESTTLEDAKSYIERMSSITCTRFMCTDSSNITTDLTVLGEDLTHPKFQKFIKSAL